MGEWVSGGKAKETMERRWKFIQRELVNKHLVSCFVLRDAIELCNNHINIQIKWKLHDIHHNYSPASLLYLLSSTRTTSLEYVIKLASLSSS